MIHQPHFGSYSIPGRVCLGIGLFCTGLVALALVFV
jgi:hypothetical protein